MGSGGWNNVLKTQIAEAETVEVIKKDKKKKVFMIWIRNKNNKMTNSNWRHMISLTSNIQPQENQE
jgi:hypothetical protein